MAFEKYSTTPKYRFSGLKLSCLEALALVALWAQQRHELQPGDHPPIGYRGRVLYNWRRFCAANLEHDEWRKKAWASDYNRGGYNVWFPRAIKRLQRLLLVDGDWLVTDAGKAAAVHFTDRLQPAMNAADFRTYTNTTLQRVRSGKGAAVWIP